ncbi:hypothetical protein AB0K00_36440 [Dactylosporangium sp. NPDC049525]|uniref:hypothetical protein n=1 Tax=Dactylosporangium sp. NPDC049525 TaxID=3154730 RepID=UPI0034147EFE
MRGSGSTALTVVVSIVLAAGTLACSLGDTFTSNCTYAGGDQYETGALAGEYSDPKTGTVTLAADGTFTANGLRTKGATGEEPLGGHGTWSLRARPSPADTAEAGMLVLTFRNDDGTTRDWTRINPGGSRDGVVDYLFYLYGDLESCELQQIHRTGPRTSGLTPGSPTAS